MSEEIEQKEIPQGVVPPKIFEIEDAEDGQFYVNTRYPRGDRGIGLTSETMTRKANIKKGLKSFAISFYEAYSSIGFDPNRIGEIIKDNTKRKSSKK